MSGDRVFDVCVIGGGPAGAVAATLLANWGHSVVMVHRQPRQSGLAESLPGSTRKLFGFLELLDTVEAERFHPNTGNASQWGGESGSTRSDVAGYHVERAQFDAALRRHASRRGVTEVAAAVRDVLLGDPSQIICESQSDPRTVYRARYVLDCSGRAGVVGRRLFERRTAGYRTVAFIAEWEAHSWPRAEDTQTAIESYADGWAWSVPVVGGRRVCTVMVDPRPAGGRGAGLQREYTTELAKTHGFAAKLSASRQISRAWTCDATVYQSVKTGDAGVLLVGDAASFVEPLSSAGVRKAMTSAWRAAVVVNTSFRDGAMSSIGRDYFEDRERRVYSDCLQRAGAFFSAAAAHHRTDFWQRRACGTAHGSSDHGGDSRNSPDDAAAARAALQRLQDASPSTQLAPGTGLRFASAPEVDGQVLTMQEGILFPGAAAATVFAAGVRLAPLARIAVKCRHIDAVFAQYGAHVGTVPPDELLSALALLVARGVLIPVRPESHNPDYRELSPAT